MVASAAEHGPVPGSGHPAPLPVASTDRLLTHFATTRDPRTREVLVDRFTPLTRRLARKYARPGGEAIADLEQVALVALLKALDRYDPSRGFAFMTFATPTILGELRRHFRDATWAIHLPRQLQEDVQRVERASTELSADGTVPTPAELAAHLDISVETVLEALAAGRDSRVRSIDVPIAGDDDHDTTLVEHLGSIDPGYNSVEYGASASVAVRALSGRDREILRLRFVEDLTQTEIARRVGLSQMQVSRILASSLRAMRVAAISD